MKDRFFTVRPLALRGIALLLASGVFCAQAEIGENHQTLSAEAMDADKPLELETLLEIAAQNSLAVKAAAAGLSSAEARIEQAGAFPDPMLSYSRMSEGMSPSGGYIENSVEISQNIPWFGKRGAKQRAAKHQANAEFYNILNVKQDLYRDIKTAFYQYALLHESLELNRRHLDLLVAAEAMAGIRYRTGDLSQNALLQTQIEKSRLEDKIAEAENRILPQSAGIWALLGFEKTRALPPPAELAPVDISADHIEKELFSANPELRRLGELLSGEVYNEKAAQKDLYPDLTPGVEFIQSKDGKDASTLMLSLDIPVWRKSKKAAATAARAMQMRYENELLDTAHKLKARFRMLSYEYNDAIRKTKLYRSVLIPKAEQAAAVALKGFEAGTVTFPELIESQRSLIDLRLELVGQIAGANIKAAELNALIPEKNKRNKP